MTTMNDFGSPEFWREWPLYGYGGLIHHIVQMTMEHHITSRKAVELVEFAVRVNGAHPDLVPPVPQAPWDDYLHKKSKKT